MVQVSSELQRRTEQSRKDNLKINTFNIKSIKMKSNIKKLRRLQEATSHKKFF